MTFKTGRVFRKTPQQAQRHIAEIKKEGQYGLLIFQRTSKKKEVAKEIYREKGKLFLSHFEQRIKIVTGLGLCSANESRRC